MNKKERGLDPVWTSNASVLILGSFPSEKSLFHQQYYGNPANHFWRVVFGALSKEVPEGYDERIALLQESEIALWDVYASCERKGSLDSKIKEPKLNDFKQLLANGHIQVIVANGARAYKESAKLKKTNPLFDAVEVYSAPSTSPANTHYTIEKKIVLWREMLSEWIKIESV